MVMVLSILIAACLAAVANASPDCHADTANPLEARQGSTCASTADYFARCGKCCPTLGAGACYRPIRGSSTGAWDCYPTPPGLVVGTYTDSATATATRSYAPTSSPAITPGPSSTDDYYASSSSYYASSSLGGSGSSTCAVGQRLCVDREYCCPVGAYCFYNSIGASRCAYGPRSTVTTSSYGVSATYTGSYVIDFAASQAEGVVPTLTAPSLSLVSSSTSTSSSSSAAFTGDSGGYYNPSTGYGNPSSSSGGDIVRENGIVRAIRWLTFVLGLALWA